MTIASLKTAGVLSGLKDVLRLRPQFQDLGMHLLVWDRHGQVLDEHDKCMLASTLHLEPGHSVALVQNMVQAILEDSQPHRTGDGNSCFAVGVPLFQRRRLIGAATLCFMPSLAAGGQPGPRHDADGLLRFLSWMVNREVAMHAATEELGSLSTNLATTYEELSLLYRISGCMKVTSVPEDFIQSVCDDLIDVMDVEAAVAVVHAHPSAAGEPQLIIAGDIEANRDQLCMFESTHLAPMIRNNKQAVLENAFAEPQQSGIGSSIRKFAAASFTTDDQSLGTLMVINKRKREFDSVDLKLLQSIANQASVFLMNNRLFADLQDLLMGVLHALTATIDAKDPYTRGHSQRVALLSKLLAQKYGMSPQKSQELYLAGLLHDIGKIGVPEAVLSKEGRLTPEEYGFIKHHPLIGSRILQGIRQLDAVIVGILTHHERPDGRGYPQGLAGDQVPIEGRIVGLADVFDAMTSDRTYRKALGVQQALDEIGRCKGTQFDPELAELLLQFDFQKLMEDLRQCASTKSIDLIASHGNPK